MSEAFAGFVDLCVKGEASPEEIDDYVDRWHEQPSKKELHEFLGMTWDEYSVWINDPDFLLRLIKSRRDSQRAKSSSPVRRNALRG